MFDDRREAGIRLGEALERYRDRSPVVLAIPRGGVPVGKEVARRLDADFSLLVSRKLPFPENPEAGFGAVAEDGSVYIVPGAERILTRNVVEEVLDEQRAVVERRIRDLRGGESLPDIDGRVVILVDDGVAVGSTLRAAARCVRNKGAAETVIGTPVGSATAEKELGEYVDHVHVLFSPPRMPPAWPNGGTIVSPPSSGTICAAGSR